MKSRRITRMGLALTLLLWVFLPANALAQDTKEEDDLTLLITNMDPMPIAVADAHAKGGADAEIGKNIAEVLRNDLKIAGYFAVLEPGTFLASSSEGLGVAETDFTSWYSSGAEVLVKAEYKVVGSSLDIDFRVYDVLKSKEVKISYDAPSATTGSYKKAVHAFANALMRHYFGFDGFFGQTLLTVRKGKGESHVYMIGTDGSGLTKVSSGSGINLLPAWGPSGSVLYTSYDSGNPDLKIYKEGSSSTLSSEQGLNSGASYCSGSGKVALTLTRDDNPEIYVMNADGSGLERLTNNGYIDTSPSWSPDCSQMAFTSNRGGSPQIYVMNADGSGAYKVTTVGDYNTTPSWAPTGNKIAFTGRDEYNVFDIFVADAGGGNIERLTQDTKNNEEPVWSKDGRYLAFTSTRSGSSQLYIMTADGRFQTAITEGGGFETPAWSR